jgi:hypothetical protein
LGSFRNGPDQSSRLGAGRGAFKAALDALSTVFKLVKENRAGGKSSPEEDALVDRHWPKLIEHRRWPKLSWRRLSAISFATARSRRPRC